MGLKYTLYRPIFNLSNAMSQKSMYAFLDGALEQMDQSVVHVGSGGPLTKHIKDKQNIRLTTLDIDASKKPDIVCDLTDMKPFDNDSVDCFLVMEVLEHVRDPQKALSEIFRVLKPGGTLIFSTPFLFHLHDEPHDYWRFTKHALRMMTESFSDVVIRERNGAMESIVVAFARNARGKDRPRLREFIMIPLAVALWPLAAIYDKISPDSRSTTGYFVTARKPN